MQAYEKLHKLIVEYVCKKDGLDRAISDEYAGDEVRAAIELCSHIVYNFRKLSIDFRALTLSNARSMLVVCLSI
jgi:hypothetical protein